MGQIELVVCGLEGRMGQAIEEVVSEVDGLTVKCDFLKLKDSGDSADCLIDFSSPEGFSEALSYCVETKTPFVSGTTGLTDAHYELLNNAGKIIPVLWAPNMSLGIQWINQVLKLLSKIENDFSFQLEEVHHTRKVDSPSGTALMLQKTMEEHLAKKPEAPLALRGGGVFGIHKLFAFGEEETITLEHQALNRKVFARGAVRAAEFLSDQPPGRYDIAQALGF